MASSNHGRHAVMKWTLALCAALSLGCNDDSGMGRIPFGQTQAEAPTKLSLEHAKHALAAFDGGAGDLATREPERVRTNNDGSLDWEWPCNDGGRIYVYDLRLTNTVSPSDGAPLTNVESSQTFRACAAYGVTTDGELAIDETRDANNNLREAMRLGQLGFSGDISGSCALDFTIRVTPEGKALTAGTMCGYAAEHFLEIPPESEL